MAKESNAFIFNIDALFNLYKGITLSGVNVALYSITLFSLKLLKGDANALFFSQFIDFLIGVREVKVFVKALLSCGMFLLLLYLADDRRFKVPLV